MDMSLVSTEQQFAISYEELKKFRENRQQLDRFCYQIFQIIQDCNENGFLPHTLIKEVEEVSKKIQSQRFRVAVIGEFSQGKSTLLNALLGEEIQPAREIPCSGTVTVLKYGKQKRVVCLYKDGREEEISFEKYQDKASISEDAAIDCLSDELAQSQIEEIIFEHPDLELCRSGVEIVDSPGLNEHPERTAITRKLLKNTDAVIFLTNASRPLTQGERDLLHEVKLHLNGGKDENPVDNLFVICNFMDLIRTTKGREQVKQRVTKFLQGDNPIIAGKNRIHFISAQAALDAILTGNKDNYLEDFLRLTSSIEKFLIFERGTLTIQRSIDNINDLIQKNFDGLVQAQNILEGKIKISEAEKQKIFEQIGEASGRDLKIRILASKLAEKVLQEAIQSFEKWHEKLGDRIVDKSSNWNSKHSPVWSRDELIGDYTNCFMKDLSYEIDQWGNEQLQNIILRENLEVLRTKIEYELDAIQEIFRNLDTNINTSFSKTLKISIDGIDDDFMEGGGIVGGIGIGGALAAGLFAFTGIGFITIIIASVVTMIASSFGLEMLDIDGLHDQIKRKILDEGLKKFDHSLKKVDENMRVIIDTLFNSKIKSASQVIAQAISLYENLLEQQEKAHQGTLEEREADKTWISQKRQELEQVHKDIKSVTKL